MTQVRRSADRFVTRGAGLESRHCFAFGAHYDAGNTRFGSLLAVNEESVEVGAGFALHPHAGVDIVTWVLSGRVEHGGPLGAACVAGPGDVHVLRSGSGVSHTQISADGAACRYLQFWVAGSEDETPVQDVVNVAWSTDPGGLSAVVTLDVSGATMYAARPGAGQRVVVPPAALLHVFVATGAAELAGVGELDTGDSARLGGADAGLLTAIGEGCEVLVWAMRG